MEDMKKTDIQGFTLIELIIVIVIGSILAVYAMFHWPTPALNIDAQAQQFANDIRYTRSSSMSKGERYRIIKLSSSSYTITNNAGTSITFPSGQTIVTFPAGITFGAWNNLPNNLIAFDSKGVPYTDALTPGTTFNTATTYSITLVGGGVTKTVTVSPTTGRVVVT